MDYRYLKTRGALIETGESPAPAPSGRDARPDLRRIPPEVIALLPEGLAREGVVLPVALDGESLTLAAADPDDLALADKITFVTARRVRLVPAPRDEIVRAIDRHYGRGSSEAESVDSMLQEFDGTLASWRLTPAAMRGARGGFRALEAAALAPASLGHPRPAPVPAATPRQRGFDPTPVIAGGPGVLTHVVEEGQRILMRRANGTMEIVVGPRRVWRGWNTFRPMQHFVAHPGDYLIVRYRDGRQEHLFGPTEAWLDPRAHLSIQVEEALQLSAKEAVVVYSQKPGTDAVQRRIEYGPALFMPRPGEWLHTFSWHASQGGSRGVVKIPNGLVFQKLWLMPDQMYHDVADVRTSDDAVLTIRLMLFFELLDITTMLDTTHDPIGDFVNAATSDVVDFTGRHDFESFKRNTDQLNELSTYRQLAVRAQQCGYRINKVVYRGYGAPDRLQQMHDQAIEARTRLQLERATEQQAQELENYKLESQLLRASKRRAEQADEVTHDLELDRRRQEAGLESSRARVAFARDQARQEAELRHEVHARQDAQQREHLAALRDMGVDLTAFLTQSRADRVIEFRGDRGDRLQVLLDPDRDGRPANPAGATSGPG